LILAFMSLENLMLLLRLTLSEAKLVMPRLLTLATHKELLRCSQPFPITMEVWLTRFLCSLQSAQLPT
jgi:hypothetical protein